MLYPGGASFKAQAPVLPIGPGESSHTYAWSSSLQHHCLGSVEIKFPIQVLMPQNLGIDSRRDGGDSLRLAARASQLCGSITDGSYPTDVCEACFQAMVTCWQSCLVYKVVGVVRSSGWSWWKSCVRPIRLSTEIPILKPLAVLFLPELLQVATPSCSQQAIVMIPLLAAGSMVLKAILSFS
jgi:hypothetical protein